MSVINEVIRIIDNQLENEKKHTMSSTRLSSN